ALDPMNFQLLTDDFPAASYPAIPAPLVIDPVAENGPIGMVVSIQCGSRCLERLNQHGHANQHADPDEPAQQGQRNTPACGQAQPALFQAFHDRFHSSPRISSSACPSA